MKDRVPIRRLRSWRSFRWLLALTGRERIAIERWSRGRRGRERGDRAGTCVADQSEDRRGGGERRRAEGNLHRTGDGNGKSAGKGRDENNGHRSVRDQRSLCRAMPG